MVINKYYPCQIPQPATPLGGHWYYGVNFKYSKLKEEEIIVIHTHRNFMRVIRKYDKTGLKYYFGCSVIIKNRKMWFREIKNKEEIISKFPEYDYDNDFDRVFYATICVFLCFDYYKKIATKVVEKG